MNYMKIYKKGFMFSQSSKLLNKNQNQHQIRMLSAMPKMTSVKHLSKDSTCPPVEKDLLRVYNMRFCPYAQRSLLILHAKGITDFEIVNVHLKNKPDWFIKKNPLGKVPTLEFNGQIIPESVITSDCIDTLHPNPPMYPSDPYMKHVEKGWISKFENMVALPAMRFYFLNHVTEKFEAWTNQIVSGLKLFEDELKARGTLFFGGSQPGMVDYMIWPWFERMPTLNDAAKFNFFPENDFPCLTRYHTEMLKDKAVQATIISDKEHRYFISSLIQGNPDYDMARASKL